MKVKPFFFWVMLLVLMLTPLVAQAQDDEAECGLVYMFDAWARSTPAGAPNGAAFGLLVNLSGQPDTLIGASTDAAEVVELHEMVMGEGDVMQMRPVEGGFAVEPNTYLQLRPGGLHIMLVNLTAPLIAGESIELMLDFEHADDVTLTVPIKDLTEIADEGMGLHGNMGNQMHGTQPEMTPSPMSPTELEWGESCIGMHVVGAWARPAGAGMPNSAAYGLLVNLTMLDDVLVSGSTDVAAAVELHEMVMGDSDVMQMHPMDGGIPVPTGGVAVLQRGGLHVMLIGLNRVLEAGTALDLVLTFAEYGDMELLVPIQDLPEEMAMPQQ